MKLMEQLVEALGVVIGLLVFDLHYRPRTGGMSYNQLAKGRERRLWACTLKSTMEVPAFLSTWRLSDFVEGVKAILMCDQVFFLKQREKFSCYL